MNPGPRNPPRVWVDTIRQFGRNVFAPWYTTYMAVEELLHDDDEAVPSRERLTSTWAKKKLDELQFVGLTVRGEALALFTTRD